jgi:hypothetical protein
MATAFSSATNALLDAVACLADEPLDDLTDDALGADIVALRGVVDRVEAQFIRRVQRFDLRHAALADGAVSTVSWLRARCGLTGAAAAERVRMARVLEHLPETTASFAAGRSPFANVAAIAHLAHEVGAAAVATVEETLVPAAETLDAGRMRYLTAYTRHRLDADGALDADNRAHDRRWFSCDQLYGGVYVLRGELDAENGAVVSTALAALSTPAGPEDERVGSQRRADALVEICSRQLQSGSLPAVHGQRPHLTLTVELATLQREAGAPPAEMAGGAGTATPVHAETARRITCDSVLRLATLGADGEVLSVGRATRTVPAAMRTALHLRDRGCRFRGCDRPAGWTDGHHVTHWADGGETSLHNLVSLCRRHHRMVHEHGWDISLAPDRGVTVSEPRGSPARASP